MNLKQLQFLLVAALSVGAAHGQSVVIDGGGIRVDASSSGKGTVTKKTTKNSAGKTSKTVITSDSDDDADSATVTVNNNVSSSTSTHVQHDGRARAMGAGAKKEFVNSDLSGQNLSRRNYAGASFTNVEAVGTNFNGSDLSRTVMTNVDLSKADLRGANLTGAQMTNVDWNGALLEGAIWLDGRRCAHASTGKCM